ncbi:magnesium transporter [Pseudogemmobacter faecipullorum]|uniref:Magnesium transporter MgtE n=1 Tax=Pseudogemmobacter faecipullorum TaxID=2755041 RepID=A0ABS8CPN3_9RHOB|nr:magnesium transporter [Pseudogemmobacter faecipullorum]MCB5411346.1 magnesium transporter [Pseudogemmobacter faecipullorum]
MREQSEQRDEKELQAERLSAVLQAVENRDASRIEALLGTLHPADIADLLEQISPLERSELLALWHGGIDGDVLSEIDESIREEVIEALPDNVVAEAVRELDTDDVVDILEDLDQEGQEKILSALENADRVAVEQALAYPEHSAGRLMQRETVTVPEFWSVGETSEYLRRADWLPDQFYHVILVDPRMRPVGYTTLGRMLSSPVEVLMRDITEDSFRTVKATDEEADVAYYFNQYHLISCPVVDENGRLVGVITIDDAMNVLDEEHEEDMLRLARVGDDSSIQDGPIATARQRLPWLAINLVTASLSAMVISQFDATIAQVVILAALMPIVASTGGIAGTQSLAVSVRGLATRDLTSSNARRVVRRELFAGMVNGVVLAAILFLAGTFIIGDYHLGLVLASAMLVNQVVAALGGVLVPLTLNRFGLDPALASATFVTTLTDVMGFFAFLGLATVILI